MSEGEAVTRLGSFQNMLRGTPVDPVAERSARLKREAVAWLSLLSSGTATTADAEALKRWCREDPAHNEAYAKAALVWDMMIPVAARAPTPETARLARPRPAHHGIGRRAFLGGALTASAACAAYAVIHPPLDIWPSLAELRADIRTGTGEQRRIKIADGVMVDLNTRSSLALNAASEDSQRIELIAGEAVVTAGSNATSACVVIAGDGRIVARDAKVDVRYDDARIRVACLDGRVRVERGTQAVILPAGEQVVYDGRNISGAGLVDPAVVTAWQRGRLVFQKESLSRVIDEVNRYRPGRIVLVDRDLGRHLIDASFNLDRLDNVIVYVRQAFDARVTVLPGGLVLVG
jgi:transmembrane sensor